MTTKSSHNIKHHTQFLPNQYVMTHALPAQDRTLLNPRTNYDVLTLGWFLIRALAITTEYFLDFGHKMTARLVPGTFP